MTKASAPAPDELRVRAEGLAAKRSPEWSGWDPYDMLLSPVLGLMRRIHPMLGVAGVQAGVRLPINLRSLLLVPGQRNAKTISLVARGALALYRATGDEKWRESATRALALLDELRSPHAEDYACWGYPFPWQSILLYLPPGAPSGVCTVFAAKAYLDAYHTLGSEAHLASARSACDFMLSDLTRIEHDGDVCFSYIPGAPVRVHNANMLVAALLSQVHAITGDDSLIEPVESATRYTLADQREDGSWFYDGPPDRVRKMIDNYHTLFVLEALRDVSEYGNVDVGDAIDRGHAFWRDSMIEPDGAPVRKHGRSDPVELRDLAQALLWLCDPRLGQDWDLWGKVYHWGQEHMLAPAGHYTFRHGSGWASSVKTDFPRLQAWMFLALARSYEERLSNTGGP